jgi:hypothetical protein
MHTGENDLSTLPRLLTHRVNLLNVNRKETHAITTWNLMLKKYKPRFNLDTLVHINSPDSRSGSKVTSSMVDISNFDRLS